MALESSLSCAVMHPERLLELLGCGDRALDSCWERRHRFRRIALKRRPRRSGLARSLRGGARSVDDGLNPNAGASSGPDIGAFSFCSQIEPPLPPPIGEEREYAAEDEEAGKAESELALEFIELLRRWLRLLDSVL